MHITNENVIRRPVLLTEKASRLRENDNQVIFEVRQDANKAQIKNAVEAMFKVTVEGVNTAVFRGKDKRMGRGYAKLRNWKKAIVTLKAGDSIQFFEEEAAEGGENKDEKAEAEKAEKK
jgi:large subunit ribosomal protein L23